MKRQIHLKKTAGQWQYTHFEDGEQLYPWQYGPRDIRETLEQAIGRFGPAETNLVDIDPGDAAPFEQYLLVTEFVTGRRTAMEISDTEPLDIGRLVKRFVRTAFGGELNVANIVPILEGDWHAAIITDRRDPDSAVIWSSASFYLEGGDDV